MFTPRSFGILLVLAVCPFIAWSADPAKSAIVTPLIEKALPDFPGKELQMITVQYLPGAVDPVHRHNAYAFVYVLEGEYELGIDDQPTKKFRAGETFYEPTGCLHRVSKNPSAKGKTRLIAVVLHPRDAKEIAIQKQTKK